MPCPQSTFRVKGLRTLPYVTLLAIVLLIVPSCAVGPRPDTSSGARPSDVRIAGQSGIVETEPPDTVEIESPDAASIGQPLRAHPCPQRILDLVQKTSGAVKSLKATVRVSVTTSKNESVSSSYTFHAQGALLARSPDGFRLKLYVGPVNVLDAARLGDSLRVLFPSKSLLFSGSLDEVVLPTVREHLPAIVNDVIFPRLPNRGSCKCQKQDRKTYRLDEDSESGRRVFLVESATGRIKTAAFLDENGAESVVANYGAHRRSGRLSFPTEVSISLAELNATAMIHFDRVELNGALVDEAFNLQLDENTTVRGFRDPWAIESRIRE